MSKLANIMIGIVLFSMIIVGTGQYIKGFQKNYDDIDIEEGWEDTYNYAENMSDTGKVIMDVLNDENANWATSGLKMGYSVLKSTFLLPRYMGGIFSEIAKRLSLPTAGTEGFIISHIAIIVAFIIVFIVLAAIVRWYI